MKILANGLKKKRRKKNTNTQNVEYKRHGALRTPTAAEKENAS